MPKSTPSKTIKKTTKSPARPRRATGSPLARAHRLVERMLKTIEGELASGEANTEKLLAQMPKLIQLLEQLEGDDGAPAAPPLSDDDLAVLKEWLGQRPR